MKRDSKLYFFGFSRWKQKQTRLFFPGKEILFCKNIEEAQAKGIGSESEIYIWGKKPFPRVEAYAKENTIPLFRVEDGFIRSVSLGSDLTKAYSLVVDSKGIYFDPTQESDLEYLLNTRSLDTTLLERARRLKQYLLTNKISKYNLYQDRTITLEGLKEGQKIIMVPGQVEDDASIIYGAKGMSNLALLQETRKCAPDAYIIFKPHPDVLAGNRKGDIPTQEALRYCDTIITKASLDSVLVVSDEVHTMTSLVGFEALLRGKEVYTYGMPFYAGWGLTHDRERCSRRQRKRSLDELIAMTYILYPKYVDPRSGSLCEVEVTLANIELMKTRYNTDIFYRTSVDIRNFISRKIQLLIKVILGE